MADQIVFFQRKDRIREKSQHVINVTFRDRATAANVTPTNIRYRIDDPASSVAILDWTAVSADDEVAITITPTQNALLSQGHTCETRELVVAADYGLATQFIDSITYTVENLRGVT